MSAVGKLDFLGDFDEHGQLVETPYRPQLAKKSAKTEPRLSAVRREVEARRRISSSRRPSRRCPAPLSPSRCRPTSRSTIRATFLLTAFGKATLTDRYLMPGESFQDMFARVSCAYADDVAMPSACMTP